MMTVKELRKILKQFKGELEVRIYCEVRNRELVIREQNVQEMFGRVIIDD